MDGLARSTQGRWGPPLTGNGALDHEEGVTGGLNWAWGNLRVLVLGGGKGGSVKAGALW